MSSPHSKALFSSDPFTNSAESIAAVDGGPSFVRRADRAIDAALRNVPLPDGLMRRLGLLAGTLTEGVSDQVDYLGC
jgi:hypothetical protein